MESQRIILDQIDLDGIPVTFDYADIFVVLRDGTQVPATTDWEVQIRTGQFEKIAEARHDLAMGVPDGSRLRGAAIVRFSDGHRHLFRGDDVLDGFERGGLPAG